MNPEATAQFTHYEPVNGPTQHSVNHSANENVQTHCGNTLNTGFGSRDAASKQYAGNYEKAKLNNS